MREESERLTGVTYSVFDLIAERGLRRFSLAEVTRRLGVNVAAPYRHFPDRDALLAAVRSRPADLHRDGDR